MSTPAIGTDSPKPTKKWRVARSFAAICALLITICVTTSCSVFLAVTQPPRKNLSLLAPGTSRMALLAEFGVPTRSRLVDWKRIDVFTFTQGYTKESRAGRAIAHGTADVITGGLWELAGTPTEMLFSGDKVSFEVAYDSHDRVLRVSRVSP